MPRIPLRALRELADLYGVQTAYRNAAGSRQTAASETLLIILRLLGAPVHTFREVPAALCERQLALWQRHVEPVAIAWNGKPISIDIRLARSDTAGSLLWFLQAEAGDRHHGEAHLSDLPTVHAAVVAESIYEVRRLALPIALPLGYHRFTLETKTRRCEPLLIVAPRHAYAPLHPTKEWDPLCLHMRCIPHRAGAVAILRI
jgi:hypothetical protein